MTPDDSPSTAPAVTLPPMDAAARLPAPPPSPMTWGPLGALVMRPWYDRLAVKLVPQWYFPLSRAWAAALECGGDGAVFVVPIDVGVRIRDGARGSGILGQ